MEILIAIRYIHIDTQKLRPKENVFLSIAKIERKKVPEYGMSTKSGIFLEKGRTFVALVI